MISRLNQFCLSNLFSNELTEGALTIGAVLIIDINIEILCQYRSYQCQLTWYRTIRCMDWH